MKKTHLKHPKTIVFVQARMGSTRFPGKIMKKIGKREILLIQLDRMKRAKSIDQVVVITTTRKRDDAIVRLCQTNKTPYYRGNDNDLLDRHYKAARKFKADVVVKIPSDCPLIDPTVMDKVIEMMQKNLDKYDFVSNLHPPSFPDGLDVEAMPFKILEIAWKEARKPHEREHCTPYIWDNPQRFRIGNVVSKYEDMFMIYRWTLDYPEDFEFFKAIFAAFKNKENFLMQDVLRLLKKHPEITAINSKYAGVNWYRHVGSMLKTVDSRFYRKEGKN